MAELIAYVPVDADSKELIPTVLDIDLVNRYRIEVKRYRLADWRATRVWYAED